MSAFTKHILVPAIAPIAIAALYFTPVSLFGYANRGLMALAVVLISLIAGIVTVVYGIRARAKGDPASGWWIASMCARDTRPSGTRTARVTPNRVAGVFLHQPPHHPAWARAPSRQRPYSTAPLFFSRAAIDSASRRYPAAFGWI
jgi:hypothetical protein